MFQSNHLIYPNLARSDHVQVVCPVYMPTAEVNNIVYNDEKIATDLQPSGKTEFD